ncbi:hypothetical protein G4B88_010828, partial [Cannabis sativa]
YAKDLFPQVNGSLQASNFDSSLRILNGVENPSDIITMVMKIEEEEEEWSKGWKQYKSNNMRTTSDPNATHATLNANATARNKTRVGDDNVVFPQFTAPQILFQGSATSCPLLGFALGSLEDLVTSEIFFKGRLKEALFKIAMQRSSSRASRLSSSENLITSYTTTTYGDTTFDDPESEPQQCLPTYDPLSQAAMREQSRIKSAHNAIHLIPLLLIFCAIVLWIFSYPEQTIGLSHCRANPTRLARMVRGNTRGHLSFPYELRAFSTDCVDPDLIALASFLDRTTASSSAQQAPCPRLGVIGCHASPTSTTPPEEAGGLMVGHNHRSTRDKSRPGDGRLKQTNQYTLVGETGTHPARSPLP